MIKYIRFLKKYWFIFGIVISVILGFLIKDFASWINTGGIMTSGLVIILFFIQGLLLPGESIISGVKNIKLHFFIQTAIFIFYPLYFYFSIKFIPFNFNEKMIAGLFALACLPTTVSSCTVFTTMAGGNISGTIFNAALANITGVIITPLLFSLLIKSTPLALPVSTLIKLLYELTMRIIIPIAAGQILRIFTISIIDKKRTMLSSICNIAILIILFIAFSGSSGFITLDVLLDFYPVFIFLALTYILISFTIYKFAKKIRLNIADVKAAVFTASQKTLALGVPLITLYFNDKPQVLGIVLIPLLFYHPWQLFISSFIVNYFLGREVS